MRKINNKAIKVLVDLKPAFDGYSGIPQETRLLFAGLKKLDQIDAIGLVQHGGRLLDNVGEDVNQLSRFMISLTENPYTSKFHRMVFKNKKRLDTFILMIKSLINMSVRCPNFKIVKFEDLIWRLLFSKTLKEEQKKDIVSGKFCAIRSPRKHFNRASFFFLKFRSIPIYPKIETKEFDILIAQSPLPARVSKNTKLIIRYHDSVPILMPHTINDRKNHRASHLNALKSNIKNGAWFACVSETTRNELIELFPEVSNCSVVIHNIVSDEYFIEATMKAVIPAIVQKRINEQFLSSTKIPDKEFDYLLMVSTVEPRKNHILLLEAWERLKLSGFDHLKLVIVGNIGWDNFSILESFRLWGSKGELFFLSNVPASELRCLYSHAAATICPSLSEGFDYSGIEAMKSGGVVVSSDIPIHREIYGIASEYFDPKCSKNASAVIQYVLEIKREDLKNAALEVSSFYNSDNILKKWSKFLVEQGEK